MRTVSFTLLAAVMALGGCETPPDKETVGGLLGATGGALLGAQFGSGSGSIAMAAVGATAGLLAGAHIGRQLDEADRLKHEKAAQAALESAPAGTTTTWNNPDSGNSGTVTPTRTYQRGDGTYCREFTQKITVGGKEEDAHGTACRQPDGSWKIVS